MKNKKIFVLLIILLFPFNIYAYSNKIAIGGETIGIEVHSDGVYIVGFYDVYNKKIAQTAGFEIGDIIKEIDHNKIYDITSLNNQLQDSKEYTFSILRNNQIKDINLKVEKENNIYKTGLYVKDQINGIGTLSYIDPETKIFGSLGHEILETTSFSKFLLKEGNIYKAEVSSIKKSVNGNTGEKNANIEKTEEIGEVNNNTINGIFGKYTSNYNDKDLIEIATKSEIKKGNATIRTVLNENKIENFQINILSIDEADATKNILFEIIDDNLIKQTGGIVQGMSGSPIIQNHKIIGVVNYVIIDDAKKGYGIFIETMLEEGDKLLEKLN